MCVCVCSGGGGGGGRGGGRVAGGVAVVARGGGERAFLCSLANFSVAYEETQTDYPIFFFYVCPLFPKAILFTFILLYRTCSWCFAVWRP